MKHLEARAALLRVKECDLRMDCLLQCDTSIDRGLHVGGAFSSLTAMTALYYSGLAAFNVTCPTDTEQDLFVLSKGHAVAALAAVYADLGYISRSDLYHSRGYGAAVKGHPGRFSPAFRLQPARLGMESRSAAAMPCGGWSWAAAMFTAWSATVNCRKAPAGRAPHWRQTADCGTCASL